MGKEREKIKICPNCGFKDDPMWKPLAWRIYWEYAPLEDFKKGYPEIGLAIEANVYHTKRRCKEGNFYYNFEDQFYYYQLTTKRATRKLVRRFPKGFESMANRALFEKTPSEKGYPKGDIFQKKLNNLSDKGERENKNLL